MAVSLSKARVPGRDVSNPAAWGWEWTTPDSGTRCQLVNIRGTRGLTLGMRVGSHWHTVNVDAPERFITGDVRTLVDWANVVGRWFAASQD